MSNLIELGAQVEQLRTQYKEKYESFPLKTLANGETARDIPANDIKTLRDMMADLNAKSEEFEGLKALNDGFKANEQALSEGRKVQGTPAYRQPEVKTAAQAFLDTGAARKDFRGNLELDVDAKNWLMQAKATMTTGANGYPPQVLRDGNVVPAISRPPQLLDFLRIEPTNQNGIKFMAQTVRTNTAAAKSEGTALVEATITYAEQTDIISRIGVWIPVTEEQMEDEPGLRTLVDQDLGLMTYQVLDEQVTVGDGSDPNLLGIFNSGSAQTQAKGADPVMDAMLKAITKVRVTARSRPSLIVMHATDHQNLALTRTSDGLYILGNPTDGAVQRLWGLPIALSEALTVTNAMVLDTDYFRVKMRKGITIAVSDSHASNFIANTMVVRAHVRAGIQHLRSQAVCKVTGLPS